MEQIGIGTERQDAEERIAILVDVQNIYYTVKEIYNAHFNYSYFFSQASAGKKLIKAIAYATARNDRQQSHFQDILKRIGFEVRLIPYIQRSDGTAKANWDAGISLDILEYSGKVDVLVLASGDGDHAPVIKKALSLHPIRAEVYGVPKLTAFALVKAASRFIPIDGKYIMPIPVKW